MLFWSIVEEVAAMTVFQVMPSQMTATSLDCFKEELNLKGNKSMEFRFINDYELWRLCAISSCSVGNFCYQLKGINGSKVVYFSLL